MFQRNAFWLGRALRAVAVVMVLVAFIGGPRVSRADLILHYALDETSGTTANDATGSGNHGTLLGTNFNFAISSVNGVIGNALEFDQGYRQGDRIVVTNNSGLPTTGDDFTFMFHLAETNWKGVNSYSRNEILANYNINDIQWNIALRASSGEVEVGSNFGTNKARKFDVANAPGVVNGEFAHLAFVFTASGGISDVYLNGSQVTLGSSSPWGFGTGVFSIGNRSSWNDVTDGVFDDIGLWTRALESQEVLAIYNLADWEPLNYHLGEAQQLFDVYAGGSGSQGIVGGNPWQYVEGLDIVTDGPGTVLNVGGWDTVILGGEAGSWSGVQMVPEPGAGLLLLSALACGLLLRRRRAA